jgi:hypothetical protein
MFDLLGCIGSASIVNAAIQGSQNQYNSNSQLQNYYTGQPYNQNTKNQLSNQQSWQQTFESRVSTEAEDLLSIVNNIIRRKVRWKAIEGAIAENENMANFYEEQFSLQEDEVWMKHRMIARLKGSAE